MFTYLSTFTICDKNKDEENNRCVKGSIDEYEGCLICQSKKNS